MPTTPKSIQGLVAISEESGIKPLGYLTWFSVPDQSVSLRTLKKTLALNGLPIGLAPKDTKAIHVFKRAMREEEGIRKDDSTGVITETDVAQVMEDFQFCIYQISMLERDQQERVVEYPKALRVIFNKQTEEIDYNLLGGAPGGKVIEMQERIEDFYAKNAQKVTGARVRSVVRNYIKDEPDEGRNVDGLSGENMRGKAGGIYFVPAKHADALAALSNMLHELYKGHAYLHAVPLADGATERELVRRHHTANTREEMIEAIAEVRKLASSDRERAPRSDVVANQWSKFHAMRRRAASYKELLDDEAEEIETMGEMLKKQLDRLTSL
jgi:hypothetical protein